MITAILVISDSAIREQLAGEFQGLSVHARVAPTMDQAIRSLDGPGMVFTDDPSHCRDRLTRDDSADHLGLVIVHEGPSPRGSGEPPESNGVAYLPVPVDRPALRAMLDDFARSANGGSRAADPAPSPVPTECGKEQERLGLMVGESVAMRGLFDQIVRIAPSSASVLLTGESGTGKEVLANAIHSLSARSNGPFVAVNCGAISPTLMESELFGHERGSFTGATRSHRGFFERAHEGTLFLDEITEMPLDLQVKLLRVLETSCYTRIGGETEHEVNVRVLAASNRPLDEAIGDGRLREDLYYRLKVLHLDIPPLRARPADIAPLARHFLTQVIEREGRVKRLCPPLIKALEDYHWPGNARELRNAIYTGYLLSEGDEIVPDALPEEVISGDGAAGSFGKGTIRVSVGSTIADVERELIMTTLEHLEGNKTRTAEALGVSVKTLYNRLHEYGMMETGS